ncbi:hypothetical protein Tco_0394237 [Tanacetum coccineum]
MKVLNCWLVVIDLSDGFADKIVWRFEAAARSEQAAIGSAPRGGMLVNLLYIFMLSESNQDSHSWIGHPNFDYDLAALLEIQNLNYFKMLLFAHMNNMGAKCISVSVGEHLATCYYNGTNNLPFDWIQLMTSIRDLRKAVKEHGALLSFFSYFPVQGKPERFSSNGRNQHTLCNIDYVARQPISPSRLPRSKVNVIESVMTKEEEEAAEALFALVETFADTDRKGTAKA